VGRVFVRVLKGEEVAAYLASLIAGGITARRGRSARVKNAERRTAGLEG
jgi:hypothetical protein